MSEKGTLVSSKKRRHLAAATGAEGLEADSSWNKFILLSVKRWLPTLHSVLVQVKIGKIHLVFPQKSLLPHAAKTVQEMTKGASKTSAQYLSVTLPSLLLENSTHKPVLEKHLSENTPIVLPDSVWNTKRDNLPLSLHLKGFCVNSTCKTESSNLNPSHQVRP